MIGQPQKSQGVIREGEVAPVGPRQPQTSDTVAFPTGNIGNEATPTSQEILNSIGLKVPKEFEPKFKILEINRPFI